MLIWQHVVSQHLSVIIVTECEYCTCSPHSAEGCAPPLQTDAGGDLRSRVAHSDRERHGRRHQFHQRERETSGPLHLLLRQEGERQQER